MPLLASALSILLLSSEVRIAAVCLIALIGYFFNTVMKVFVLLGEHSYLSPFNASWAVPTFQAIACAVVAIVVSREIPVHKSQTTADRRNRFFAPSRNKTGINQWSQPE